jgi:hypothetical protein
MHKLIFACLSFVLFSCTEARGQRNRFSGWFLNTQNIRLNNKFSFQFDNQLRTTHKWKSADLYIMRAGITLALNKEYAIATGYNLVEFWKTIENIHDNITEHRFWQQIQYTKQNNKNNFQHRIRIEERWMPVVGIRNNKFYKKDENINSRFRYWSRWQWPLSGNPNFQKGFFGTAQEELLLNLTGARHTNKMLFDQVRGYIGTGYRLNKNLDVEAGYMFVCLVDKDKKSIITNAMQLSAAVRL